MKRKNRSTVADYRQATDAATPRLRPITSTPEKKPRSPVLITLRAVAGLVAASAAGFVFVAGVLPTFGRPFEFVWLVPVAVLGAAAVFALRGHRPRARWFSVASVAAVAVCALFFLGARDQVIIDGRVYPSTSPQAQGHRLVHELYDDLTEMSELDVLLTYSVPDAQANFARYDPARNRLESIGRRWSNADLGALPDPDFIDVVNNVKTAATFGATAMDYRQGLLLEPDQRAEQALVQNRQAFVTGVLTAGALLNPLADRYNVELRVVVE